MRMYRELPLHAGQGSTMAKRYDPAVVHSGVEDAFVAETDVVDRERFRGQPRRRALICARASRLPGRPPTRRTQGTQRLGRGQAWPPPNGSAWTSATSGGDRDLFRRVRPPFGSTVPTRAPGHIPVETLAAECKAAALNGFVAHDGGFHHKLLELLACGWPIVAVPRVSEELDGPGPAGRRMACSGVDRPRRRCWN